MSKTADYVWMDGEIVPWQNAQIHVSTEAVLRGANVFEGMRAYWQASEKQLYIFRNDEHLRRLRQSAKIMRMSIPYTDEALTQAFIDLIRKNRYTDNVHFRPVVYFGTGDYKWKADEISTGAFILAFSRPPSPTSKTGIQSCVSSWRRGSDNASPSRIKAAGNYHNSRLAYVDAKIKGFDTPIMLNERGDVSEGPASCFMMVRDGVVITPPVNADILESITRDTLIQLFRDELGVQVLERDIDRSELYIADEAFFCGSGAEVVPIVGIDHYPVGDGKVGPLTRQIQEIYFQIATDKNGKYSKWLLPVYQADDPR
jgi:branched-chain amino acid aminotransferase